MRIGIVSTHAWPIPNAARTGDIWVLDLAIALLQLGHDVVMFSPAGTQFPNVFAIPCSSGGERPSAVEAEMACWATWKQQLLSCDIVHDISQLKIVALSLQAVGRPVCCTLTGGPWRIAQPPPNLIVQTRSQRERVLRGATDYEGTKTPELGGGLGVPVADAHVVHDGIDTGFYAPTNQPAIPHALWLNRWHPTKGCAVAIQWAVASGYPLLIAGEAPENETSDYQASYAALMFDAASKVPNIKWQWLPGNPDHDIVKRDLYAAASALIYTTQFQEPFGLSQVEALACGTPVIATRYGSIPEIVEHGLTGWICTDDAGLFGSMSDGYKWALASAVHPACREQAVARFDRSVMAKHYLAEYEAIIGGASW